MSDRDELISDIANLKAKRDRLLAQVKEAENGKVYLGIATMQSQTM